MQKNRVLFLYISILISLPQCRPGAYIKKSKTIKRYNFKQRSSNYVNSRFIEYKAHIEGVECALCAQTAIDLIKNIDGVVKALYEQGKQGYDDGQLVVTWDTKKGEVPQIAMEKLLEKEEFFMEKFRVEQEKLS